MFRPVLPTSTQVFKEALLHKIKPGDKIGVARPLGPSSPLDVEGFKKTLIVGRWHWHYAHRALLRAYKRSPCRTAMPLRFFIPMTAAEFCYKDFWKDLETVPGVEVPAHFGPGNLYEGYGHLCQRRAK